jgi:Coenzyme PQQ synthesis protein D (PqqD)
MVRRYASAMAAASTVSRDDGVLAERVLADTPLLDPATGSYVRLNESGSVLWDALEQPTSVGDLAARLAERYDLDPGRATTDAERFVASLAERGMVRLEAG